MIQCHSNQKRFHVKRCTKPILGIIGVKDPEIVHIPGFNSTLSDSQLLKYGYFYKTLEMRLNLVSKIRIHVLVRGTISRAE